MMSAMLSKELILLIGYEIEITHGKSVSVIRAKLVSYDAEKEEMLLAFNTGDRVTASTLGEKFQIKRVTKKGVSDGQG